MNPLNKFFNPEYHTPVAIQNYIAAEQGATVLINPPYEQAAKEKPRWKKGWAKKWRAFGLYFYVSNCRLKKRPKRDLLYTNFEQDKCQNNRRKLYERQEGKCPICGTAIEYDHSELHHILPVGRFPELSRSIRNGIVLCHRCHKEIHMNPWKNIQMMKAKAAELGIDLHDKYDYGKEDCPTL